MKSKLTENVVLFDKSTGVQVFVDKVAPDGSELSHPVPKGTEKKTVLVDTMTFSADRKIYNLADCIAPELSTVDGLKQWLTGFNKLPCKARSGYDSFVNHNGPTNPESPKVFKERSLVRIILPYLQEFYVACGGTGDDAVALLTSIPNYKDALSKQPVPATRTAKSAKPAKTAEQVLEDLNDEELLAFIAKRKAANASKITVPAPDPTDEGEIDELEPEGDIEETEAEAEVSNA